MIQGCHGEAEALKKETNTARSPRLEDPRHTGRSEPDHMKGGRAHEWVMQECQGEAKGCGDGEQCCPEPRIEVSRAQGEKGPRIRSSREAGSGTRSSRTAMEKQRPRGRRPTPPRAQVRASRAHGEKRHSNGSRTRRPTPLGAKEGSNQGTWGEGTPDGIIQRSRVHNWIMKD